MKATVKVMQVVPRSGWSEVELQVVPEEGGAFTRGLLKGAISDPDVLAQVTAGARLTVELTPVELEPKAAAEPAAPVAKPKRARNAK